MATRSEALTAICCLTAALHFYRFLAGQRKGRERERKRVKERERQQDRVGQQVQCAVCVGCVWRVSLACLTFFNNLFNHGLAASCDNNNSSRGAAAEQRQRSNLFSILSSCESAASLTVSLSLSVSVWRAWHTFCMPLKVSGLFVVLSLCVCCVCASSYATSFFPLLLLLHFNCFT